MKIELSLKFSHRGESLARINGTILPLFTPQIFARALCFPGRRVIVILQCFSSWIIDLLHWDDALSLYTYKVARDLSSEDKPCWFFKICTWVYIYIFFSILSEKSLLEMYFNIQTLLVWLTGAELIRGGLPNCAVAESRPHAILFKHEEFLPY